MQTAAAQAQLTVKLQDDYYTPWSRKEQSVIDCSSVKYRPILTLP